MIRVLPQTLINQIAAGEVVVRMASVVKELVENSIDAGARRIEVFLSNDLRDVEVRDDGSGMSRDDAELCLQRHATSKIATVEDLFNLSTRGFRGEAMPSIASVARMEIQTRTKDALAGTRIVVEGGRIDRIEAVGCPPGTRIMVRDLFFNTPARLKFLKSAASEANAALTTMTRQALAQPHIAFRVEKDGREALDVPGAQTPADRFRSLLGSQLRGAILALDSGADTIRIGGHLAHPHDARGDRRSQYFFINGRPFSSRALSASLEQACRGFVMASKYPSCCITIDVPPGDVDFNVHPTKEEVRFRDERAVASALYHAAREALEGSPALVGEIVLPREEREFPENRPGTFDPPATPRPPLPGFFTSPESLVQRAFTRKQERQGDWIAEANTRPSPAAEPLQQRITSPSRHRDGSTISAGPGELPDLTFWRPGIEPEPLGQISETYVIVRFADDLLIVDQHAAHERLVYLQLKRRERDLATQQLLIPVTMELGPAQSESLRALQPELAALGFEAEPFGPRAWAIQTLPADLPEFNPIPMIEELLGDFEEATKQHALDALRDRILIRAACHGAIRAGQTLDMAEMRELLRQIRDERLSFTCPHGRPTIVRLGKGELDRQFKRVV